MKHLTLTEKKIVDEKRDKNEEVIHKGKANLPEN